MLTRQGNWNGCTHWQNLNHQYYECFKQHEQAQLHAQYGIGCSWPWIDSTNLKCHGRYEGIRIQ